MPSSQNGDPHSDKGPGPQAEVQYVWGLPPNLCLDVLREQAHLPFLQQTTADLSQRRQLHLVFVFAVNVQEDSKQDQQASPNIPEYKIKYNICGIIIYCDIKKNIKK